MLLHLVQWAVVFFWQIFLCYSPKIQFWWYHNTHHLQVLVAPGEVSFKEQMSCYIHDLTTVWEPIFHCHKNQEIFHLMILFTILHMYFTSGHWIINVPELVNQFQQKPHYISPIYFEILALALDVKKVEDFNHWINSHPRTSGSDGWASCCHAGGCEFNSSQTNTQGLKITE